MLLAEGAVDLAAEPELELYDMAALDVIVREAGGRFTSLDGTAARTAATRWPPTATCTTRRCRSSGRCPTTTTTPTRRRPAPARSTTCGPAATKRVDDDEPASSVEWHAHRRGARGQAESATSSRSVPAPTVRELLALLAEHNVGALIVSGDGAAVDGIVSERDVVRRLHDDESVLDGPVGAIMTRTSRPASRGTTVDDLHEVHDRAPDPARPRWSPTGG